MGEVSTCSGVQGISQSEYEALRGLLKQLAGIELGHAKTALLESRLVRRLSAHGLSSYVEYLSLLRRDKREVREFVNAMTTNKTEWFRESEHFDFLLHEVIPERAMRGEIIQVWSGAASTGEECYSLAMALQEEIPFRYRILGTDIDTAVLARCEEGRYKSRQVKEQVPPQLLHRYFEPGGGETFLVARQRLGEMKFRPYNLIESALPPTLTFDVIFLRNVLIYFDAPTVHLVIARMLPHLKVGGFLFIGHSETLAGGHASLVSVAPAVFQKRG